MLKNSFFTSVHFPQEQTFAVGAAAHVNISNKFICCREAKVVKSKSMLRKIIRIWKRAELISTPNDHNDNDRSEVSQVTEVNLGNPQPDQADRLIG